MDASKNKTVKEAIATKTEPVADQAGVAASDLKDAVSANMNDTVTKVMDSAAIKAGNKGAGSVESADSIDQQITQIITQGGEVAEGAKSILTQSESAHQKIDSLVQQAGDLAQEIERMHMQIDGVTSYANEIVVDVNSMSDKLIYLQQHSSDIISGVNPFIFSFTIFTLACFVGYYVVWKVTPALHTPLMSLTNAISGVIIIGAMISASAVNFGFASVLGLVAVFFASVNIFGGIFLTERMLEMFKDKNKTSSK